jgi:hypothetical protein
VRETLSIGQVNYIVGGEYVECLLVIRMHLASASFCEDRQ